MANFKFPITAASLEAAIIILFALFVKYDSLSSASATEADAAKATEANNKFYAVYQDVNVMMFVGFAFLMVFLRKGSFSSVSYTFFVTAYIIQVSVLWRGLVHCIVNSHFATISLGYESLINGLYASAAILISLGAYLGKVTPFQLVFISSIEVIFYCFNEGILYVLLGVADVGGSIVIHTFGAYFGLAASFFISKKENFKKCEPNYSSTKESDTLALVGTVFLWMFWPSFNCAIPTNGSQVMRTVFNTVMSLTGSCISTFIASTFLHHNRINIIDIQNATLAGGVSIGAVADLNIGIYGAFLIGNIAGWISTIGYKFLQPKGKWMDTCGVHNLHGMTGIFGGICSVIAAISCTGYSSYQLGSIYPAIANRTNGVQAGIQFAAIVITLAIAIATGAVTGLLTNKLEIVDDYFADEIAWEIEEVDDAASMSSFSAKEGKISLPMTTEK